MTDERKIELPGWRGSPCDGGNGYVSCNFINGSCVQCGRLEGAADDSAKAPLAPETAFDCSAWFGELEAALAHAQRAMTGLAQSNHPGFAAVQIARDAIRNVLDSERRHSPNGKAERLRGEGGAL